jgi:hypothetical protein
MLPLGFAMFGGFAVRVDMLERIAAEVRTRARGGASFSVPAAIAAEAGLTRAELGVLIEALGFRPQGEEAGVVAYGRPAKRRPQTKAPRRSASVRPTGSPFAVLADLRLAPRA